MAFQVAVFLPSIPTYCHICEILSYGLMSQDCHMPVECVWGKEGHAMQMSVPPKIVVRVDDCVRKLAGMLEW